MEIKIRTLVRALVRYASELPEAEEDVRTIAQMIRPDLGIAPMFESALESEKAFSALVTTQTNENITVGSRKDQQLLCKALAALVVRAETSSLEKVRAAELAGLVGAVDGQFETLRQRLQLAESPEANRQWRSSDGRTTKLKDMQDSHLLNAIKFMERSAKSDQAGELLIYHALMNFKPQPFVQRLIERATKAEKPEPPPMYWAMRREAERRGMNLPPPETKEERKATREPPGPVKTGARAFSFE